MKTIGLALTVIVLAAAPPVSGQRREIGNLIVEGVPEIPRRVSERTSQYRNVRAARFLDWEPSGRGMLISTRFGDSAQVHHVEAPGAHRRQLTFFREPVSWAGYDPAQSARGLLFRMDVGGGEAFQYHWFDLETGTPRLLTDGKSRNDSLVVANAGGKWAFTSTRRNGRDFDIWLMSGRDAAPAIAKEVQGRWGVLDWSRDDREVLVLRWVSVNESHLYRLDVASGDLREVNPVARKKVAYRAAVYARSRAGLFYSSDEDGEFARLTYHDLESGKREVVTANLPWDVEKIAISRDGKWLAYTANEEGASALYLAPAERPGEAARVDIPRGVLGPGMAFDRQGRRLGLTLSNAQSPGDAYAVDLESRAVARWTFSEVGGLDPRTFVVPELVRYPTFDGRTIPAWYYRPRAAEKQPFPVIISIHGGPESQARPRFSPLAQYAVNELGAAVLEPNVRGSTGYGRTYAALDDGIRREDSVKDIGKLLDWIAGRPELDAKRVATFGASYGGYMVLASLVYHGDRLACGIDLVGISNFLTFLKNTKAYRRDVRRVEYGDERDPKMREFLGAISPLRSAHRIRKPLFVIQGLNDPRVPASESEQIVKTVRENGGSVWYLLARDEGHGFRKKANRDYAWDALTLFLEKYLGGG